MWKKIKTYSICLLLGFILFACAEEHLSKSVVEDFPLASCVDKGEYYVEKLSDYAKSLHYIPLETNDQVLLQGVYEKRSSFGNGYFYLLSGDKIYKFSDSGKFVSTIGAVGNGPGEYVFIKDVDFDFQNNKLYIKNHDIELLEYTTDGDFLRSIPIKQDLFGKGYFTWCFKILSPNLFFFELTSAIDKQYMAMFSNDSFKQTSFIETRNPVIGLEGERTIETDSEIYKSQNEFYLYKTRTDTIYRINPDSLNIEPKYVFDYGPYKMSIDNNVMITQKRKYIKLWDIMDSGFYIFMNFDFNVYAPEAYAEKIQRMGEEKEVSMTMVCAVYDKKKGAFKLLRQPVPKQLGLLNDLDGGIPFWPGLISADGKSLFMVCTADKFIDAYGGKKDVSEEVKAILSRIDEESNPIIIRADLK